MDPRPLTMPMPHPAGVATTVISRTEPGRERDPALSVKLYSWWSEEFHKECALVYSSLSNPSHTCISHWRVYRDKVIFTLQDHLCMGNPVMLRMEIKGGRYGRSYKIRGFRTVNLGGKFTELTDREPELRVRGYKDRIGQRECKFMYSLVESDIAEIVFSTGIVEGPALWYTIFIRSHRSYGMDGDRKMHFKGLCSFRYVQRKPSSNVIGQLEGYVMQQEKQLQGNHDIHKASSSSSSTPTLTQSSAILNSGENRGPFSGAVIKANTITFGGLTEAFRGLSMGFYK